MYNFEIPKHHKSIIKVIGVGGGGSNAVNHMFNQGIMDVEFVVCNTDAQALKTSPVPNKIQIGLNLTEGLGAGANPEKGRDAAVESKDDIRDLLADNTKMLFVTAGMGGGTGTGAAPVIAKISKEMDILTVGIVTVPFAFEGKKKMEQAESGIRELKQNCDTVLVILNDKLREIYGNLAITDAFAKADNVLTTAAKGIAEIITVPGYVNVDFQDVKTVMLTAGAAVMGSATMEGEGRARRAAEGALVSPLLNNKEVHGAKKILLSIISGEEAELQMDELTDITEYITEMAGDEADVIFGHGVDPGLGENIRVTVIATGFDQESTQTSQQSTETEVFNLDSPRQVPLFESEEPLFDRTPDPVLKNESDEDTEFDSGYHFDFEKGDQVEHEDDLLGIDEEFNHELRQMDGLKEENSEYEMKHKRELLDLKRRERIEKLSNLKKEYQQPDDIKQKLDQPAYTRRNVKLDEVPHSSEKNISKLNLNDDNHILGNNKFLHDNVD